MNDDLRLEPSDPFDDELRRRLGAGAHHDPDPDVVLDGLRPRFERARTQRRAAFASAGAALVAVVVTLVVVLGGGGGGGSSVHTPPASGGPVRTVPPAPTTAGVGGSATDDTRSGEQRDPGSGATEDSSSRATEDTLPSASGGEAPTTTAPSASSAQDVSYSSEGGSITVHFADGVVSLASSSAASGYSTEVHDNGPTRVEVRFSNGEIEWRIRVDVVNGELQPEITQH